MKCPYCSHPDSKVIDSRPGQDGASIRRRRECLACQRRFKTFEITETMEILVLKKDGTKELFDRSKLLSGLLKACYKRPVDAESLSLEIEAELQNSLNNEISTREIGEIVMEKLRVLDEVAYVRFASVYREFKDIDTFLAELKHLKTPLVP
jgi:transcriptional repressor NrdR